MYNSNVNRSVKGGAIIAVVFGLSFLIADFQPRFGVSAQAIPTPTPTPEFDQAKALAALR